MPKTDDQHLRQNLAYLIAGGGAHAKFEDAVRNLPPKLRGAKPENFPHSPWMLLEHLRLAQRDILEFSRNPKHKSPKWPEGYWPKTRSPAQRRSLDEKHPGIPRRSEGHAGPNRKSQKRTYLPRSPGATAKPSFAKPCWWPTTTPIT